MKVLKIDSKIIMLSFEPDQNCHFSINIFIIQKNGKAIVIDTGYEYHGAEIQRYLDRNRLYLESIILSHFHDDHIGSVASLKATNVYGHKDYQLTLGNEEGESDNFIPVKIVSEITAFEFESLKYTLIPLSGGHSDSDMLTLINNEYLHVGDLILESNDGKPILPSVKPHLVGMHIEALKKLNEMIEYPFLLSHGPVIYDTGTKKCEIEDRIRYLEKLRDNKVYLSYSEATKSCTLEYLHSEWHEYFYR